MTIIRSRAFRGATFSIKLHVSLLWLSHDRTFHRGCAAVCGRTGLEFHILLIAGRPMRHQLRCSRLLRLESIGRIIGIRQINIGVRGSISVAAWKHLYVLKKADYRDGRPTTFCTPTKMGRTSRSGKKNGSKAPTPAGQGHHSTIAKARADGPLPVANLAKAFNERAGGMTLEATLQPHRSHTLASLST